MPTVTDLAEICVVRITLVLVLLEPFGIDCGLLALKPGLPITTSDVEMMPLLELLEKRQKSLDAENPFAPMANGEIYLNVPTHLKSPQITSNAF